MRRNSGLLVLLPLLIKDLFGRARQLLVLMASRLSGSCQIFIPDRPCSLLREDLLVLRVPVAMVVTLRSMGAHSWQRGGQSNSSLRFVPGKGSGLKCSPGDQSTLLLCTMLSSTGWMSPLLPPGMIKVSISLKVTFSASLQECGILGLFFFP